MFCRQWSVRRMLVEPTDIRIVSFFFLAISPTTSPHRVNLSLVFLFLQLFFSDPSGMFVRYKCKAIGSGSEGAQSTLQEGYSDSLTLAEAEALAVSTLKQVILCSDLSIFLSVLSV